MKHKKLLIPFIIILIIVYVIIIILEHMPAKYQTITLEKEPRGIYSTPYSNELTVVYDDKIVLYNELGDKKEYTIELAVSYMEPMGDYPRRSVFCRSCRWV